MHSILVPWRHREQLAFPACFVYEPEDRFSGSASNVRFSVPIAQRPGHNIQTAARVTVAPDLLRGWAEAVETMPPAHWQVSIGSKKRPWVRDMDSRFQGSILLTNRLDECRTANTPLDQVFEGADLCLWVEPIHLPEDDERDGRDRTSYRGRDMPRAWLALVGVDICAHGGRDWTPIPRRLLPKH